MRTTQAHCGHVAPRAVKLAPARGSRFAYQALYMVEHVSDNTVPAQLALRAAERPLAIAHEVVGVGKLDLGEWESRSNAVARGLIARDVTRGDRVVLPCSPRTWIDYAVAYVGVQKAGAIAVPVLEQYGQQHVARIIAEAGAVGVVGGASSSPEPAWWADCAALEEGQSRAPSMNDLNPEDDAEILFTSGTTGTPKGVVATHTSVLFTHSKQSRGDRTRRVLHALPPGSLAGQGLLLQPLDVTAHQVITLPEFGNKEFLAAVERYNVTDVVLVPALVGSLVRFPDYETFDLSSVEVVRTMSAPIAPTQLEMLSSIFTQAAIINMYTSTEAWPARTRVRYSPARPESVGKADRSGSVRIVNDAGEVVGNSTRGNVELSLAGAPQRRYLGDPEASARVFLPGGWVRTGDIGYLDSEGYLYLVDRNVDLVISGGVNISTIEVEAAIREVPEILDVAVLGMPHRILGEYLVAAVKTTEDFSATAFDKFLEERLGPVKAPKRVVVLNEIPRNATGKILKNRLREQLAGDIGGDRIDEDPQSALDMHLGRFWSDALGEEFSSPIMTFVESGGTSLGAMEIVGRVRSELGIEISQRDVFGAANVFDFCRSVRAASPVLTDRRRAIRGVVRPEVSRPQYGHPNEFQRTFPTTYSQRWFFYAHNGAWSTANIPLLIRLHDGYDKTRLELALEDLVVRHEALRTTLSHADGEVLQHVHDRGRLTLEVLDLLGHQERTGDEGCIRRVQDAMYEPFYLQGGPLARARVCRLDQDHHILVLSAHHTICDGWSSGVIYRDLVELYRARCEQRPPRLPRLDAQFTDYVLWEHKLAQDGHKDYWRERLGGSSPRIRLGGPDGSEDEPARMRGWICPPISATTARDLHTLALELGTTQARVLTSAVIASIREYFERSITIGLVTANRTRPEFLNMVGNLADFLPVRVTVPSRPAFADLVAIFDESVSEAYDHRLPFDVLADLFNDGNGQRTETPTDIAVNYMPRSAQLSGNGEGEMRRLFEDEDFHGEIDFPDLVMNRQDLRSDIDYTFHPRPDGAISVAIFANIAAIHEEQVGQLAQRLVETLQGLSMRG